jgi:hypothetical protein
VRWRLAHRSTEWLAPSRRRWAGLGHLGRDLPHPPGAVVEDGLLISCSVFATNDPSGRFARRIVAGEEQDLCTPAAASAARRTDASGSNTASSPEWTAAPRPCATPSNT